MNPDSPPSVRAAPRVLVVDDEEAIHRVVENRLHGFDLVHAYNGWQAKEAAERGDLDVVLLDLNLPDTTGLELLETGLGSDAFPVVVMFSMDCRPSLVERSRRLGAAAYLEKTAENFLLLRALLERIVASAPRCRARR